MQPRKDLCVHPCNACRSLKQSFSIWVFANRCKNFSNGSFDSLMIHRRFGSDISIGVNWAN